MSERLIVRQDHHFGTGFWAVDAHDPEADEFQPVEGLHDLTPYGMMLASLAVCTSILINSYAQNHHIALDEVEIHLAYDRVFDEDCKDCDPQETFREEIQEEIFFHGNLTAQERQKLFQVSRQCPIHKIFEGGIQIKSELGE
jgi:putative redox protein